MIYAINVIYRFCVVIFMGLIVFIWILLGIHPTYINIKDMYFKGYGATQDIKLGDVLLIILSPIAGPIGYIHAMVFGTIKFKNPTIIKRQKDGN